MKVFRHDEVKHKSPDFVIYNGKWTSDITYCNNCGYRSRMSDVDSYCCEECGHIVMNKHIVGKWVWIKRPFFFWFFGFGKGYWLFRDEE